MPQHSKSWNLDGPILLVGAGKMGGAMLAGWLKAGLARNQILIQDPSLEAALICRDLGVAPKAEQHPDVAPVVLLMAVKPQVMGDVFPTVARLAGPKTVTLSIAAGKTLASFEQHLPPNAAVVRAMPNTPASIGRGMTVLCANAHVSAAQRALCEQLMSAVGEVGWIEEERMMDAVTAVSGSGPAYVFLLAEAMAAAGVEAGLDPALAMQLAQTTIAGSGELMRQSDLDAAALRHNVTSPGGTTEAALKVLMAPDGLTPLMERAVAAAVARGKDLSK